jgi:molecular chaperone IbpA
MLQYQQLQQLKKLCTKILSICKKYEDTRGYVKVKYPRGAFSKEFLEVRNLCVFVDENNFREVIYRCKRGDFEEHRCPTCNAFVKLKTPITYGFDTYCSYSCRSKCEIVKNKKRKTFEKNWGISISNPFHLQDKFITPSIIKKYGVDNVMHVPSIAEKASSNSYKNWKKIRINNTDFKLQGYEHLGLKMLLDIFSEKEILFRKIDMPELWYEWKGSKHRYYPDFFIPSQNLIVEVKSEYTYFKDEDRNMLKRRCSEEAGYGFQFLVFNDSSKEDQFLANKEKIMFYNSKEINDLFNSIESFMSHGSVMKQTTNAFPFYNIKKSDDNTFMIEFAVAGYGKNDIEIEVDGTNLRIKGNLTPSEENFVFKGITTKPFEKVLKLASGIEVTGADLSNGMLQVFLEKASEFTTKKINIGEVTEKGETKAKKSKPQVLSEKQKDEITETL